MLQVRIQVRRLCGVALLVTAALVVTGCHQVRGGGWIQSAAPASNEKATFGFTARCTEREEEPFAVFFEVGEIEWADHGLDYRFHGKVDPGTGALPVLGESCEEAHEFLGLGGRFGQLTGEYFPQPSGLAGRFLLEVEDTGEPGIDRDQVRITLTGGQYDGYSNTGEIQGGNIQTD